MGIEYRKVTTAAAEPTSPANGDGWIKPIGTATYQEYIYINAWIPANGGGTYVVETDADNHYRTVVSQETPPDSVIQTGWLWIKESTEQAYLYLFGTYVPYAGA